MANVIQKTTKGRRRAPRVDYLPAAMALEDASGFLPFFQQTYPKLFCSYRELCTAQGVMAEFEGNPLVFILANEPRCCVHVAREFLDMPAAKRAKAAEERSKAARLAALEERCTDLTDRLLKIDHINTHLKDIIEGSCEPQHLRRCADDIWHCCDGLTFD